MSSFFLLFLGARALFGLPQGMEIVSGEAHLASEGSSSLVLKTGERTVLHWDQFSLGQQESIHFAQPHAGSSLLNRVVGKEASHLLGKMSSNGVLFLLNPNGILIGPQGRIEAAGFFASTLDLPDSAFLEETSLPFQGESFAWIEHRGTIDCPDGVVFLVAQKIVNEGLIAGRRVELIAGQQALFQPRGYQRQFFKTAHSETGWTKERAAELDPYRAAIFQGGTIEATSLKEGEGGEIFLLADAGLCQVEGVLAAKGGKIHVLGEEIQVLGEAHFDVSGSFGGGEILVGGDFQGANPSIPNSTRTFVSPKASFKADALEVGSGGKVIVWAEERTLFAGKASARGGSLGGDGGLVEVSAPSLCFLGQSDLRAPFGKTGTLLLDPTNVTISGADSGGSFSGGDPNTFTPSGTDNTINAATLETNLAAANVTITTTSGSAQAGDITVSNAVSWSTANTLTLTAEGRVTINNTLTSTNASTFQALTITGPNSSGAASTGNGVTVAAAISTVGGHITINGTAKTTGMGVSVNSTSISTTTGNITLTGQGGTTGSTNYGINLSTATVSTTDGAIEFNGTGGTSGSGANRGFGFTSSTVSASGTGTIDITGVAGSGGSSNWGGFFSASTAFVTNGDMTITATGGNSGSSNIGLYTPAGSGAIYTAGSGNISITGNGRNESGLLLERPIYGDVGSTGSVSLFGNQLSGTSGQGALLSASVPFGSVNTSNLNVTATTARTSSTFVVAVFVVGALRVKDGGTINLTGTGSSGSNPTANEHYGVCLHELSAVTLGSSTGGCTMNITGVAGSGSTNCTGSRNVGNIVCNGTNNTINYIGCKAGAGSSGSNRGVFWTSALSGAPSVTFTDINTSMPGGSYGGNSHGVNFAGNTPTFNSITCSNVNSAPGTFSCNGFLTTVAVTINGSGPSTISGTSVGTSSTSVGVQVSGGGDIINSGSGTVSISGTGSSTGTSSGNYGVRLTGSGSTIVAGTGNGGITLSGTAGAGTSQAISIDTSSSLSGTGTGTISITSSALISIASIPTASGPVAISGPITLGTGVTINTANSGSGANITLSGSGTVNGAQTFTMSAGTGAIAIGTAIGTTTAPTQFSATGSGGITLSGGTIRTAGGTATLTGPVTLSGTAMMIDTTNNGGSASGNTITFSGSTSTINGAQNLTLTAGSSGAVSLQGTIGLSTALTQLTVSGGGGITLSGGGIRTAAGTATFTGAVTLSTNPISVDTTNNGASAAGNNITFSSTINGAQTLTLAYGTAGVLSLGGAIGGSTPVTGLTITGASIPLNVAVTTGASGVTLTGSSGITLSGATITTASGPYLSTGPVTLATNNLAINTSSGGGANVTFSGSTSTINGARSLTLNAGTGTVAFGGIIGGSTPISSLASTAATTQFGANATTASGGSMTITGSTALAATVALSTGSGVGSASFSSNITGAFGLTLTTGTATFSSTVGSPTPLASIQVIAPTISVQGTHSVSSGPMAYTGAVALNASQTFTNSGASGTTFTGNITGNFPLLIQAASSTVTVTGAIDTSGSTSDGAQVMISAGSNISVSGLIDTRGDDAPMMLGADGSAGAPVVIESSGGSITVTQINTSGGAGDTGGDAGDITLQPSSTSVSGALGVLPSGKVVLSGTPSTASTLTANGGSGTTPGTGGTITLGAPGRTQVQSVATITSSLAGNDIEISCDAFVMEDFEAMTAYGSITIHPITSAQVGDLVATEDITISSSTTTPTIFLLTHGTGQLLNSEGGLYLTDSLHFDYTGTLTLDGTLVPSGPYRDSKVELTASEFQDLLLYAPENLILNYDQGGSPIPSPSASASVTESVLRRRAEGVNNLLVAEAELTDWLRRLYKKLPYYKGKIEQKRKHYRAPFAFDPSRKASLSESPLKYSLREKPSPFSSKLPRRFTLSFPNLPSGLREGERETFEKKFDDFSQQAARFFMVSDKTSSKTRKFYFFSSFLNKLTMKNLLNTSGATSEGIKP